MAEKINVPEIRFAGFVDPWEQRKLGKLTTILSAARVHKEEWRTAGVPFYRSSDVMAAFNGTENERVFISQELFEKLSAQSGAPQKGDVMVTGGGSVGTPYIVPDNKPLYTKDADLIWIKRHAEINPKFLYSFFMSPIFKSYIRSISHVGTIAHYTIEQVKETPLLMPCSIAEQKSIGSFLGNLDNLITLHQRKYDKLTQLKKSMLDKLFPKPGELFPEIRFAGFTDPWEQRKFRELYRPVSEKNDLSFGRDRIISVANMYFNSAVYVTEDSYLATYNVMRLGDIAFEGNRSKRFAHGRFVENTIGDGIVSHVFKVFRPVGNNFDLAYWKHAINNEKLMKDALTRSTKASTMMHELVSSDFLEESTLVPSLDEQQTIGTAIDSIDNLITLHQREPGFTDTSYMRVERALMTMSMSLFSSS